MKVEIKNLLVDYNANKDYIRQFEMDVNDLRGTLTNFKDLKN